MLTDKAPKNGTVMAHVPSHHYPQETTEAEHVPLHEIAEHA